MKVLFCTNTFEKVSNGPAKFAHLLLEENGNTGFEIRILTEDITSENQSVFKLDLHISKPFKLFGQFIRMWKYHMAAMKIRKKFEFDILVYNNAFVGLISILFFRNTAGMINDYTNADHSLTAVLKRKAGFNKRVIFYYLEFITSRISKCIIVNSVFLKEKLQKQYRCKESKFKVLHKGIENELIKFGRRDSLKKKVPGSILFVKTDFVLGGLFTLIESLKNIDREISLSIVGPATVQHEMIKKMLNEAHIPFELFDYIPPCEVYKKMQHTEIFCIPSKREAFGVANLEAMSMGCKIVSANVGGIPEALNGNRFAWLVKPDDPVALRDALKRALDTSIEKDLENIKSHLNQFSSTKVIARFHEILQGCFL